VTRKEQAVGSGLAPLELPNPAFERLAWLQQYGWPAAHFQASKPKLALWSQARGCHSTKHTHNDFVNLKIYRLVSL
jgi:hypothetical protein